MTSPSIPVAVIDDHQLVVLGLRTLFHNRPDVEVVATAHDADAALAVCRANRPRVALVDIALDGSYVDGFELARRLRAEQPDVEIVFYTGVDELGLAERAFAAGARGVVSKAAHPSDLMRAVVLASRGQSYVSPSFAAAAGRREFDDLSPKQLTTLRLLAQGLERKQIAEQMGIGEETVKTHMAGIRRKLRARTSAQAVAIGLLNSLFDYDDDRPAGTGSP